jgi:hypothetical protein
LADPDNFAKGLEQANQAVLAKWLGQDVGEVELLLGMDRAGGLLDASVTEDDWAEMLHRLDAEFASHQRRGFAVQTLWAALQLRMEKQGVSPDKLRKGEFDRDAVVNAVVERLPEQFRDTFKRSDMAPVDGVGVRATGEVQSQLRHVPTQHGRYLSTQRFGRHRGLGNQSLGFFQKVIHAEDLADPVAGMLGVHHPDLAFAPPHCRAALSAAARSLPR